MDWDAIRRAQEAQKMLDSPGVREAIEQHERLRRSGVDVSRLMDESARVHEAQKSFDQPAVREAIEQHDRLRRSGVDISHLIEQSAASKDVLGRPPYTTNVQQLLESIEALRRPMPPEWVVGKRNFDAFAKGFSQTVLDIRAAIENASGPVRTFVEQWHNANRMLNEVLRNAPSDSVLGLMIRQSTSVYEANTTKIEAEIARRNLLTTNASLAADMFVPAVRYLHFSQRTLDLISESEESYRRVALGASLVVAEEHVSDATRLIVDAGSGDMERGGAPTIPTKSYAIYDAVQLDLIDIRELPVEATYPVLVRFSSAASLAELTRQTLNAVLRCNKASRLRGRDEVFKLTIQAQEALVMLPGVVVRDESSLRDFVTYFYMLVYEGAGDQKLRFLKEQGGPMERTECDALWNLKALRNKWLTHDPEHGDSKSIDRSYRNLADALRDLGLNNYPRTKSEFEDLQRALLTSLLTFHQLLEHRLAEL